MFLKTLFAMAAAGTLLTGAEAGIGGPCYSGVGERLLCHCRSSGCGYLDYYKDPQGRWGNGWDAMDDEEDESVGRRWNGAAAQAAAMIISGMDGGSLNGPTNGGYRPPPANYNAPIVRPAWDEMDDEEDESVGRRGGWNGAAAQAAAMIISGMDGGTLNGPTNGGYRPPPSNYNAPIVRPAWDEMDDEEVGDQFSGQPSHTQAHSPNRQSVSNYFGSWDEMDVYRRLGKKKMPKKGSKEYYQLPCCKWDLNPKKCRECGSGWRL